MYHWYFLLIVHTITKHFDTFFVHFYNHKKIYVFHDFRHVDKFLVDFDWSRHVLCSLNFIRWFVHKDTWVLYNQVFFFSDNEWDLINFCKYIRLYRISYYRTSCTFSNFFYFDWHLTSIFNFYVHTILVHFHNCVVRIVSRTVHNVFFYDCYRQNQICCCSWNSDVQNMHFVFCKICRQFKIFFFCTEYKFRRDFSLEFFHSCCSCFSSFKDCHNTSEHLYTHNSRVDLIMVTKFLHSSFLHCDDHRVISVDVFTILVTFFWVQVVHAFEDCNDYDISCLVYVVTTVHLDVCPWWVILVNDVTEHSWFFVFFEIVLILVRLICLSYFVCNDFVSQIDNVRDDFWIRTFVSNDVDLVRCDAFTRVLWQVYDCRTVNENCLHVLRQTTTWPRIWVVNDFLVVVDCFTNLIVDFFDNLIQSEVFRWTRTSDDHMVNRLRLVVCITFRFTNRDLIIFEFRNLFLDNNAYVSIEVVDFFVSRFVFYHTKINMVVVCFLYTVDSFFVVVSNNFFRRTVVCVVNNHSEFYRDNSNHDFFVEVVSFCHLIIDN